VLGVVPADHCLDAGGRLGGQVDDQLVLHDQLIVGEAVAQLLGHTHSREGRGVHRRFVDLVTALALGFGNVHGCVGVAEQNLRRLPPGGKADPDRRGDPARMLRHLDRVLQRGQHPPGYVENTLRFPVDDDRELVNTQARGGVGPPRHAAQSPRDFDEQ